jgi:hypothetical protein
MIDDHEKPCANDKVKRKSLREVNSSLISSLDTGDVVLFNRKCTKMPDPLTFGICAVAKINSSFDHVGVVFRADESQLRANEVIRRVLDESGTPLDAGVYVVEANLGGVSIRSLKERAETTSSNDVAVRRLLYHVPHAQQGSSSPPRASTAKPATLPADVVTEVAQRKYQTTLSGFLPATFFPPDNAQRVSAAEKMKVLQTEIDSLLVDVDKVNGANRVILKKLLNDLFDARCVIAENVFGHLPQELVRPFVLRVDFDAPGYWIDGHNIASSRDGIFCSELVGRVLQGAGVLMRFPPASSLRPSDFASPEFGNYAVPSNRLLAPVTLFGKSGACPQIQTEVATSDTALSINGSGESEEDVMQRHMSFLRRLWRDVAADRRLSIEANTSCVPHAWVFPFVGPDEAAFHLPWRLFLTSSAIIAASIATAPLWVRQLELQHGVIARGNPLKMVALLSTRSAIATLLHCALWISVQGWKPKSNREDGARGLTVDKSHAYYSVVLPCAVYGLIASAITFPMERFALFSYFAPPAQASPTWRMLLRGSATNILLCTPYLPFAWILWYEGVMQFVLGTPFSLLRGRCSLAESHETADFVRWRADQRQCFAAAMALTLAYECVTYPILTYQRRVQAHLNPPLRHQLFKGFRLHAMRMVAMFASSSVVAWGLLL